MLDLSSRDVALIIVVLIALFTPWLTSLVVCYENANSDCLVVGSSHFGTGSINGFKIWINWILNMFNT